MFFDFPGYRGNRFSKCLRYLIQGTFLTEHFLDADSLFQGKMSVVSHSHPSFPDIQDTGIPCTVNTRLKPLLSGRTGKDAGIREDSNRCRYAPWKY